MVALCTCVVAAGGCSGVRGPASGRVIERGVASWYGGEFHGRSTANGERYDMHRLTAAHKTLPFGTVVEVRNLDNGRSVRVRINDRGPFVRGRIIDLSYAAAREIEMIGPGTARVELVLVSRPDGAVPAGARPLEPLPGPTGESPGGEAEPAVEPAGTPHDERARPDRPRPGGAWTVQIGAFREARRARDLCDLLARHFPDAEVRSAGGWHRVQVGRFDGKQDARRLRRKLLDLGWEGLVVPLP